MADTTPSFERLIRFKANDGKTYKGNLSKETPTEEIVGSEVEILEGDIKSGFKKTGQKAQVSEVRLSDSFHCTRHSNCQWI
jgi:transcription initiation factor TFIIH subunit 2